ncbi:MAG: hypothetical protein ABIA37_00225, partial [Candidatus Woesearchaeota archaeon]
MFKTIQTEVDRLINLINEEEKISVRQAAKKIGVPVSTITEWAGFLEEEGMINIEYKFTTPFLVKRKMSETQVNQIKSNLKEEKEIFDRKSESLAAYFNKLESEVGSLRKLFKDIESNLKDKVSSFSKDFNQLKKIEKDKEKLDQEIIESKKKFIKQITDLNKQLLKGQTNNKAVYNLLYTETQIEQQVMDIQKNELELIKKTDLLLAKKLAEINKQINVKKVARLKDKENKLDKKSRQKFVLLEKKYLQIKKKLENEKKIVQDLLQKNNKFQEQLEKTKKGVLDRLKEDASKIKVRSSEMKDLPRKIDSILKKKERVVKMLNNISYNEKMLKDNLEDLMKKSSALKIVGGS